MNRTYRLDSKPIMQGIFISCIYIESGDPVRVLCLLHNKYAGYTFVYIAETYVQLAATRAMCYSTG